MTIIYIALHKLLKIDFNVLMIEKHLNQIRNKGWLDKKINYNL